MVDTTEKADPNVIVTLDRGTKLRGWVRGPAGEPVGAATVACCAATVDGSFGASTQTDADGSFSLTISEGSTVWAIARSYAVGWAVSGKGDMELRLPAQVPAPPIKLRNSPGDPVPTAKVTFSTESGLVMPWKCLAIHALLNGLAAVSGDDGRLTPTGLAAGVYQAWLVSAAGMAPLGVVQVPSTSEVVVEVPSRPRK